MRDPPLEIFQGLKKEMLPSIGFIAKIDENFKEGHLQQSVFDASQPFPNLLYWLSEQTNKIEELSDYVNQKNPGKSAKALKRDFGEITSDADF